MKSKKRDHLYPGSFWTYTPVAGRRGRVMHVRGERVVVEETDGRRVDLSVKTFLREWDPDTEVTP